MRLLTRIGNRFLLMGLALVSCLAAGQAPGAAPFFTLKISPEGRFFRYADGTPFFWLGDTAWLLFKKLDRKETEQYLDNRRRKGFNVVQAMVLHSAGDRNAYGAPALIEADPARPAVTPGADPDGPGEYDYWDHIEWVLDRAAERGMFVGMVAVWGSVVNQRRLNAQNAAQYAGFLAARYRHKPNIIWINGGDVRGDRHTEVWRIIGQTLKQADPARLITFHPFGRTQSSTWFHEEPWLDFNMFQSGHRRYDQDVGPQAKGEDNWRYVLEDYARRPFKPTLDGEPSYENIPQGLHDTSQPYWTADDCRRYAYWAVFAGAFGHTYGHNSVMQMYKPDSGKGAYGPRKYWFDALDDPGAGQMQHLKHLMLSRPFFERTFEQAAVLDNGSRYDYVIVTRGGRYLLAYTYTGRPFRLRMGIISGRRVRAWWYDPRSGAATGIGVLPNSGDRRFAPPGAPRPGNDWVLVLDDVEAGFPPPGARASEP